MRIYNTKNPKDVAKIYPWLIPTDTETRMDIATELYQRLTEKPDETYVSIAIEHGITRAVLIAYKLSKRIVWIWQSNSESGFKHSKLMFDGFKAWAKSVGANKIGMKTDKRYQKAFQRKWGFRKAGKGEMRLKI